MYRGIQNNGPLKGLNSYFVRLQGCNLECKYCNKEDKNQCNIERTPEELARELNPSDDVVITGGEPMLHKDELKEFLRALPDTTAVTIETNGLIRDHTLIPAQYIVSLRIGSVTLPEILEIIRWYQTSTGALYHFKFVVTNYKELKMVSGLINEYIQDEVYLDYLNKDLNVNELIELRELFNYPVFINLGE